VGAVVLGVDVFCLVNLIIIVSLLLYSTVSKSI
jgi:hypothetical protein